MRQINIDSCPSVSIIVDYYCDDNDTNTNNQSNYKDDRYSCEVLVIFVSL